MTRTDRMTRSTMQQKPVIVVGGLASDVGKTFVAIGIMAFLR